MKVCMNNKSLLTDSTTTNGEKMGKLWGVKGLQTEHLIITTRNDFYEGELCDHQMISEGDTVSLIV